ncbi:Myosin, essential light chain family protein [Necator americanus]|uniref:Myosin, essential light chain family protein n=1 Tax=Necator americanus TaxID=51031 RepID=W2TF18_NECAM|nr:Myosin, essential light chain family protein [Necator americanus]ETN80194.1 Myosin, essential light chain family protein [Necator americanus]
MPSQDQLKEIFNLYDEELDGKIDGTQIGDVVRAAGLKPTNAMVVKASGQEFKRKGEKRITFEEWLPIFEQLSKEKARFLILCALLFQISDEQGTYADFVEGLKVFDKEECGKILAAELRHILLALGERLSADEVDEILKGAEDAEGLIKYEDFIKKVLAGPFPDSD